MSKIKAIFLLIVIPFVRHPLPAQLPPALANDTEFDGGSGVQRAAFQDRQFPSLFLLGKVWGFLKYHHPAVTSGTRHWDYELFRVMPRILAAGNPAMAQRVLLDWIDGLGPISECTECAALDTSRLQRGPQLAWLADESLLGAALSQRLLTVYQNRPTASGQSFYVSRPAGSLTLRFENELPYPDVPLPDTGYQLLALFRYWNIVEYFHPHRANLALDPAEADTYWDRVLAEEIGSVGLPRNRTNYENALLRFLVRANDTHANLASAGAIRPPGGACQFGVSFRWVGNAAVVDRLITLGGEQVLSLGVGHTVNEVADVPLAKLFADMAPYYAASSEAGRRREMLRDFSRGPCDGANVPLYGPNSWSATTRRIPASAIDFSLLQRHDRPGAPFQRLTPEVAYLKLSNADVNQVRSYVEAAASAKSWIIDARNLPANGVAAALAPHLVAEPTDFALPTIGDIVNPGAFHWGEPLRVLPQAPRYGGQVIILVDEMTEGSGEMAALMLRAAPGALVMGSPTAGAASPLAPVSLPWGYTAGLSGAGIYYPDQTPTQRSGLALDIEVRPTQYNISRQRDEAFEATMTRATGAPWPVPLPTTPLSIDVGGVLLEFVNIPTGEFLMGCSPSDRACEFTERPAHPVRITKAFQMAKYEVTIEQWNAVLGGGVPSGRGSRPASGSWWAAQTFVDRLNERNDGYHYRMATEAEWEHAVRAGTTGPLYGPLDAIAWHRGNTRDIQPVGQKLPNAWGLYDMLGNANEWVSDWWTPFDIWPIGVTSVDPIAPSDALGDGAQKTYRGGVTTDPRPPTASLRGGIAGWQTPQVGGLRVVRERLDAVHTPRLHEVLLTHTIVPASTAGIAAIKLTARAPAGGTPILIESESPNLLTVPASVTAPRGALEVTLPFSVGAVTAGRNVRIAVRLGSDVKTVTVAVVPPIQTTDGPLGMKFVSIPPGEFTLGPSVGESSNFPRRLVRITRPFEMSAHEITQAQWEAIMGDNPSLHKGSSLPVHGVSWNDIQKFLTLLNERRDGFRYRLPTEAQWEHASRAGAPGMYGGLLTPGEAAWYRDNSGGRPQPVGTKKPNAWGLYDTLGNVQEFVQDVATGLTGGPPVDDPTGPAAGTSRTIRSSDWTSWDFQVPLSNRFGHPPSRVEDGFGFRIARDAVP